MLCIKYTISLLYLFIYFLRDPLSPNLRIQIKHTGLGGFCYNIYYEIKLMINDSFFQIV